MSIIQREGKKEIIKAMIVIFLLHANLSNLNICIIINYSAVQLVECSALERENMHEVFQEAVRAALKKKAVPKRTCQFL